MGMRYGRVADNKAVRQLVTSTIPIVINGDGAYSSAPAKDEDAQYPMSNLYSWERYRVWSTKVGTADTAIKVQLDLSGGANGAGAGGLDKDVSSAAVMGLRGHAGTTVGSVLVGYRTRASGYSNTGYTNVATITSPSRDSIAEFTLVAARYWEFNFSSYDAAGMAVGSLWLGELKDLGLYWSSDGGATWANQHNVMLTPTAGGHQSAVVRGDTWANYTLAFRAITNATRATIDLDFGTARRGQPILILDENAVPRQFFVLDGPQFSQRWDGLYDATLELVRLG